jgi:hypothetical protein
MAEVLDPDALLPELDAWQAQIDDALLEDPHRTIGWEEHLDAVDRLRAWVTERRAYLDSWVACERGQPVDADGDGVDSCGDPDDGDARVSPDGTEVCNGVDDDANGVIDDDPACDDCVRHDFEDRHFLFCRWPRTFDDAEAACEARGGALAVPEETAELYVVYMDTWPVVDTWWLGATDAASEGNWVDPEGQSVRSYAYWASGEPDGGGAEDCAGWAVTRWGWADEDCASERPSICIVP